MQRLLHTKGERVTNDAKGYRIHDRDTVRENVRKQGLSLKLVSDLERLSGKADRLTIELREAHDAWQEKVVECLDNGLSYGQLAAVTGKSRVRIDQVARAVRARKPTKRKAST